MRSAESASSRSVFDGKALAPELAEQSAGATAPHRLDRARRKRRPGACRCARRDRTGCADLRWIGYLSTVGVYGDHGGGWVDETSECRPVSRRSIMRLEAESEWLALGRKKPACRWRCCGSPASTAPAATPSSISQNGTAKRLIKPGQVFNRIHVDDIAGALWHLAERQQGGVFNVTDDLPAPPQDVVAYAAGLMGVEPPPEIPFASAQLSPMARSFYGENKRVSNAAIKGTGYRFRYPDYRSAFDAMWAEARLGGRRRERCAQPDEARLTRF